MMNKNSHRTPARASLENLLAAILRDDRTKVNSLLRASPGLVSELVTRARFYQAGIFHWLYVSDTALHFAAAGYRSEIAQSLLSAGAEVNAVNRRGASRSITPRMDTSWDRRGTQNSKNARSTCSSRPGQISTHKTKTASHRSTAPYAPVVPPR